MSLIRQVLALDDDAPLCTSCAAALGGRERDKVATVSVTRCAHCHEQRPCLAARDFDLPAARRPLHAQPDNYSEFETRAP